MKGFRWQLGYVLPRLLFLVCAIDVALRFLPVEPLTFRPWEAATRYSPPWVPFEPNRQLHYGRAYGDLAALGNLPRFRQYRVENFTTDAFGYRNVRQGAGASRVRAILLGDSFSAGAAVSDQETLSAQLGALVGCEVYNAAGTPPESPSTHPRRIVQLARELGIRDGLVLVQHLDRLEVPHVPAPGWEMREALRSALSGRLGLLIGRVRGLWKVSPLEVLVNRVFKLIENEGALPNSYARAVVLATLRNGDWMLFAEDDVKAANRDQPVSADYWRWLARELERDGLKLLVLLVPNKYTVYERLLAHPGTGAATAGRSLERLDASLTAEGVPVVNLTESFRMQAAKDLERGVYLYWQDDTHWNPLGIGIAASEIRRALSAQLLPPCR